METARVDIRRLQLLNDRIAQTIDALNQVRLSVHAVQNTAFPNVVSAVGIGHTNPTSVNPYFTNPYLAQQAWGMGLNPFATFGMGLGHTTPETVDPTFTALAGGRIGNAFPFGPWAYSPFAQAYTPFASGIY
jgi:hypothetical protein